MSRDMGPIPQPGYESFPTAADLKLVKMFFNFPRDISGTVIGDIGGGASTAVAELRAQGAKAFSVDYRYRDLSELESAFKEKFNLSTFDYPPKNPIVRWLIDRWIDTGTAPYELKSQRVFKVFMDSAVQHPDWYIPGQAENLSFEPNSVDFLFSLECISAFVINDRRSLFQAIESGLRVLKPKSQYQIAPWFTEPSYWTLLQRRNAEYIEKRLEERKVPYSVEDRGLGVGLLTIISP